MSKIKSLADQLRTRLEEEKEQLAVPSTGGDSLPVALTEPESEHSGLSDDYPDILALIAALNEFSWVGTEKIVVRLDRRTMLQLRRLKLASGVDMTRVIVFALSEFFRTRPSLSAYISKTLNQFEP